MRDFIEIAVRAGLALAAVTIEAVVDAAIHPATAVAILAICLFVAIDACKGA